MKVFVTGGTGLLGNNILRKLSESGHETTALVRGTPPDHVFDGTGATMVRGDLDDSKALEDAIADCDAVIHSAALIHLGWKRLDESLRINRDASATIADLCVKHSKKLVAIGTLNAMAVGAYDDVPDEETPRHANGGQIQCTYVVSKCAGVDAVLHRVDRGLETVIVHPGFMLGPWDWKPSSGRMMVEVGKAWRPLAPPGGCSLCDARDVAAGTVSAMEKSIPSGRQYILAGHNMNYIDLWAEMAKRYGRRPPIAKVGPVPRLLASMFGNTISKFMAGESDLNSAAIRMSCQYHWGNSDRAKAELGYQIRTASETLDDAATWLKEGRSSFLS